MALNPALRALSIGPATAPNTLELFLDYLCPFSAKQLLGVQENLLPLVLGPSAPYSGQVRIVVRPYPQPWHATSTLLHEAALAAARLASPDPDVLEQPEQNAFWVFSLALMRAQEAYFDAPARHKNADQIRGELVNLAVSVLGEEPRKAKAAPLVHVPDKLPLGQAVKNLLKVGDGNSGSQLVPLLKYCVKFGRQNSIHVTPTCAWNGLVEGSISSGYGAAEWRSFLDRQISGN